MPLPRDELTPVIEYLQRRADHCRDAAAHWATAYNANPFDESAARERDAARAEAKLLKRHIAQLRNGNTYEMHQRMTRQTNDSVRGACESVVRCAERQIEEIAALRKMLG